MGYARIRTWNEEFEPWEMVPSNDHQANLMPGGNPADNDNFVARCGACRGCWVLMQRRSLESIAGALRTWLRSPIITLHDWTACGRRGWWCLGFMGFMGFTWVFMGFTIIFSLTGYSTVCEVEHHRFSVGNSCLSSVNGPWLPWLCWKEARIYGVFGTVTNNIWS